METTISIENLVVSIMRSSIAFGVYILPPHSNQLAVWQISVFNIQNSVRGED